MHSTFTARLLQANHLHQQDFHQWALQPGMLYAADSTWWGARKTRPRPHEGLDLCTFSDRQGELHSLGAGTLIPALFSGQVVAMFADFLGQSILLTHHQHGGRRLCSILAHVMAEPHVAIGYPCHEGEIIARIAKSQKAAIPAHLHLSTLWLTGALLDEMSWSKIHSSTDIHLCDPLQFIYTAGHSPCCKRSHEA